MRTIVTSSAFALAVLILAAGGAAPDTSLARVENLGTATEATPGLEAIFGPGTATPSPAAKPPREVCPGEFDISRLAGWNECTLAACNQWCIEEGASYSAFELWIAWGICACKCCP